MMNGWGHHNLGDFIFVSVLLEKGFVEGCMKFIGIGGCFLKTWIKGELLIVIERDAKNQMYTIAWAVVEKEDQHTWGWFLNLLARDIGIGDGKGWTVMSDQQKGLELAVKNLFPQIYHRIVQGISTLISGKRGSLRSIRKSFWGAAKSTTPVYLFVCRLRRKLQARRRHLDLEPK